MTSADGRLTVAFNGEIYNFRELRRELQRAGARFATQGDTEILLHLYAAHGRDMLELLDGMFAFALYDRAAGTLLLARDRLGEKPLWYTTLDDRIVFASEAKALLAHPGVKATPSIRAISFYLTIGYIPCPDSAWAEIRKLPPATSMVVSDCCGPVERYWTATTRPIVCAPGELAELVRTELGRAVESRMVSDVPLGALLSGGIDSSIIVALMSRSAGRAGGVKTFTAGFNEADFDERPAARALAEHYKTEHTELLVRPDPAGIVDRIVNMYDEPFADSSAMPTWLICRAAREHVTVALTGDGGDEAFGGYDRYRAVQIASRLGPVGYMFARLAGNIIKPFAPKRERSTMARFVRFTDSLPYPQSEQYFMHRMLFSHDELEILFSCDISEEYDLKEPNEWFCGLYEQSDYENEFSYAQMHDISTYLPDDLLVKTDIASMSSSLELRSPMLSPTVIELGLSLPCDKKAGFRRGKLILREAFKGIIPDDILKKTKRGFGVPISKWLRDELRNEMCDVLLDESFARKWLFKPESIAGLVADHLSGKDDHGHRLWALLVLARWFEKNRSR